MSLQGLINRVTWRKFRVLQFCHGTDSIRLEEDIFSRWQQHGAKKNFKERGNNTKRNLRDIINRTEYQTENRNETKTLRQDFKRSNIRIWYWFSFLISMIQHKRYFSYYSTLQSNNWDLDLFSTRGNQYYLCFIYVIHRYFCKLSSFVLCDSNAKECALLIFPWLISRSGVPSVYPFSYLKSRVVNIPLLLFL